jgi:hypothetical protein
MKRSSKIGNDASIKAERERERERVKKKEASSLSGQYPPIGRVHL